MKNIFTNLAIKYGKYGNRITIFGLLILLLFVGYSYMQIKATNEMLKEARDQEITYRSKLEVEKDNLEQFYNECVKNSGKDTWEIAKGTNTLLAYSNYAEFENPVRIKQKELDTAVENLLSKTGYVQYIESNGNKLFTPVSLSLDGQFVRFNTDKAVRSGAMGIPNCGSPSSQKNGIILKGKIVKILNLCESNKSQSVWAHIAY